MMPRSVGDSHKKVSISRNFHSERDNIAEALFFTSQIRQARLLLMSEFAAKAETARSDAPVYNGGHPSQMEGSASKPEKFEPKQEQDNRQSADLLLFAVKQSGQSDTAKQAERLLPPIMIDYGNSIVTSDLKSKAERAQLSPPAKEASRPPIKWEDAPSQAKEPANIADKPPEKAPEKPVEKTSEPLQEKTSERRPEKQSDKQSEKQPDKQTDKQADKQIGRPIEGRSERLEEKEKERLPVDGREAKEYLHGDGKSLPPIARDFANIGRHMLQQQEAAEKLRPQIYVAQKSGDSRFPQGTKENPFTSIQDAVDRSAGGTVINVAPGIYRERIKVDRSDISIKTNPENPAIIEPGAGAKGRGDAGFSISSYTSNVAIKNFEIRNFDGTKGGIRIDGRNISDITIAGNNVHSASGAEGISVYGRGKEESERVKNIDIVSNRVHNLKLGQLEAMPLNGNVSEFKVIGNAGYNLDNLYIDAIGGEKTSPNKDLDQPRKGLIAYNFADGISSANNGSYKREPSAAGIYVDGAKQLEIRHNYVRGSDFGIEIASEHKGLAARQINVAGNIFENSKLAWLTRGGEANRPGGARETSVWNNTVIGNKRVQTQENVDLQTFRIYGNQAYQTAETIRELPTAIAVLMRKNRERTGR